MRDLTETEQIPFRAQGIFGVKSRLPLVELEFGREKLTITSAKARELASMLFEAAEGSFTDAAICAFVPVPEQGLSLLRILHDARGLPPMEGAPAPGEALRGRALQLHDDSTTEAGEVPFEVRTVYTELPTVAVYLGQETALLEAPRAFDMAMRLMDAAVHGETDGAAFITLTEHGASPEAAAGVLKAMRRKRALLRDDAEMSELLEEGQGGE